jgi:ankyrin repeat protein
VISFLISTGAEVHARDGDGWTPLHNASSKVRYYDVSFILNDLELRIAGLS